MHKWGSGHVVGGVGAVGHAERVRLTHLGNPAATGRRGRRPLRAGAKRRYQHHGKQLRKCRSLRPPLGSPERGAVAARRAVTEGLGQRWFGAATLSVDRRREWAGRLARGNDAVRHPTEGASRTPPPTVSAERKSRRVWQRMWFPHASQKVRGLCPRDWIRWAVDVGKYTVCIVVKIGHA